MPPRQLPRVDVVIPLGVASPAVVPQHPRGPYRCERSKRTTGLEDSEPLGDDQRVVSDLLVCPEPFVSPAPVGHSLESLSLVEGEGTIDIGRAHHANLRRLDDGNRIVVEAEQYAPVADPRQGLSRVRLVIRPEPGCRGFVAAQHSVDELSPQLSSRVAQPHRRKTIHRAKPY